MLEKQSLKFLDCLLSVFISFDLVANCNLDQKVRRFKVALNPMCRIFYNFNKSCIFVLPFEVQRQWSFVGKTKCESQENIGRQNKLPRSAREATNLESFKTLIKTFLFKESFQLS